jgi:peptidoglycan/xylan/chitin deacetylase (PgdA/CDA1 family)
MTSGISREFSAHTALQQMMFPRSYLSRHERTCWRVARPAGTMVLMYHSVATTEEAAWIAPDCRVSFASFERQMRFLSRRRRVVSMTSLLERLESGIDPEPGTVVLTFDDGYSDNLRHAAPILQRYGLPATLYVPTSLIDRTENQWVDRLYSLHRHRSADEVSLAGGTPLPLRRRDQSTLFFKQAIDLLRSADRGGREQLLSDLRRQLRPTREAPRLTMNWDEVRAWASHPGLEVGTHTAEHLDLTSCSEDVAFEEIRASVDRITQVLGQRPIHFSFPYGRSSPQTREMVLRLGLRSAVCQSDDLRIRRSTAVNHIPRITAPSTPGIFRLYTSRAYFHLPGRLRGWR